MAEVLVKDLAWLAGAPADVATWFAVRDLPAPTRATSPLTFAAGRLPGPARGVGGRR